MKKEMADKPAGGPASKEGRWRMGATNINGIVKKELAVWKLPEVLDKSGFRH